jgi:putative transposase
VKKKRFSVEQITAVLKQAESGSPVGDVCRQAGVSEQTFYRTASGRPWPVSVISQVFEAKAPSKTSLC